MSTTTAGYDVDKQTDETLRNDESDNNIDTTTTLSAAEASVLRTLEKAGVATKEESEDWALNFTSKDMSDELEDTLPEDKVRLATLSHMLDETKETVDDGHIEADKDIEIPEYLKGILGHTEAAGDSDDDDDSSKSTGLVDTPAGKFTPEALQAMGVLVAQGKIASPNAPSPAVTATPQGMTREDMVAAIRASKAPAVENVASVHDRVINDPHATDSEIQLARLSKVMEIQQAALEKLNAEREQEQAQVASNARAGRVTSRVNKAAENSKLLKALKDVEGFDQFYKTPLTAGFFVGEATGSLGDDVEAQVASYEERLTGMVNAIKAEGARETLAYLKSKKGDRSALAGSSSKATRTAPVKARRQSTEDTSDDSQKTSIKNFLQSGERGTVDEAILRGLKIFKDHGVSV
jgi:hypothetical protein